MAPPIVTALRGRTSELLERVRGRRDPLIPPARMWDPGIEDFVAAGDEELGHVLSLARVRPDERVLELGCGVGLLARPLSVHLGPGASYDGLDDDGPAVEWCSVAYRDRPDFGFGAVPDLREPGRLPFGDGAFGVVVARALLPRVTPAAVPALLGEARRLLGDEGRVFLTGFLLDADARAALAAGTAEIAFSRDEGSGALSAVRDGGTVVAHDEEWLLDRVAEAGFRTAGIRHGLWTAREGGRTFPDILVGRL